VAIVDAAGTAVDLSEYIGSDEDDAAQTALEAAVAEATADETAADEAPAEDAKA
jgi:trigger factor